MEWRSDEVLLSDGEERKGRLSERAKVKGEERAGAADLSAGCSFYLQQSLANQQQATLPRKESAQ